jgi:peptidyl-prolyl cis-trans isomerase C
MRPVISILSVLALCLPAAAQKKAPPRKAPASKPAAGKPAAPPAGPDLPSKLPANSHVAKVNGEAIPLSLYIDRLSLRNGPEVREMLVQELLIRQEARRRKITVTPEEINSAVERAFAATAANYQGERQLEAELKKSRGWSLADYRAVLRSQVDVQILREKIAASLVKPSDVDDQAIRERYDAQKQAFVQPDSARISHILIRKSADGEPEKEKAQRAKAESLLKQIIAADGKNFDELAREHSEDEATRIRGGRVPVDLIRGGHPFGAKFDATVYSAPVGLIKEVIPAPDGYHIVRVDSKKEGRVLELADVKDQVRTSLLAEQRERAFAELMVKLRSTATVDTGKF